MNRDVVFVLLLVQAAAGLLAAGGSLALMGSPLYLVVPLLKSVALVVVAGRVARERLWAIVAAMVVQWLGLLGLWFGLVLGLFPALDPTLTLSGLLTEVALPAAVLVLCGRMLAGYRANHPLAQPVATAPLPVLVVAR